MVYFLDEFLMVNIGVTYSVSLYDSSVAASLRVNQTET